MPICMIGKLSNDQKVDWPKHLPELVHANKSTRSAITRYNPHYLMFRCQQHIPIDFYFPTIRGTEKHQLVDYFIAELHEQLQEAFKEAQVKSTSEVEIQKQYYNRRLMLLHWNQVTWSWLKLMPRGNKLWKGVRLRKYQEV